MGESFPTYNSKDYVNCLNLSEGHRVIEKCVG